MFNRLSVRTRIFTGFAAVIAISLGLAGFGAYETSKVSEQVRRMDNVSANLTRVLQVTVDMEAIRGEEARLRLDPDEATLSELKSREHEAHSLLAEAGRLTLSAQRKILYASVADALGVHDAAVNLFTDPANAEHAMMARMFASGDQLSVATNKLTDAAKATHAAEQIAAAQTVNSTMLFVRLANLRFMASNDQSWVHLFDTKVSNARAALTEYERLADPQGKSLVAAVIGTLDAYVSGFATFSKARTRNVTLYNETLQPQIVDMLKNLAKAQLSLQTAFDEGSVATKLILSNTSFMQELFAGLGLALGITLAIIIGRGIVRPICSMTAAMTRLAAGDRDVEIPARNNTDEIGEMARAVEVFRQQGIENARMSTDAERERSAKDRRQTAMGIHIQDFGSSISGVMKGLTASAAAMHQSASDVSDGAQRTRSSTSTTVEGAAASARDLSSVAAAAEEMALSINEISRQISHVTSSVQTAVERAAQTDTKVASLSEAADRIGDVVRLITNIASQTNLLALNATIEAARAGDAGKGFAVVAGEVKALATQTAQATTKIAEQIVAIRNATGEAVAAVREVGGAIGRVETVATAIAAAVEEQAAATREITDSVQKVTFSTSAAAEAMSMVLTIADATGTSSLSALSVAEEVGRTSETLRKEVVDFLAAMSGGDEAERRRYERMPAQGATAQLQIAGRPAVEVRIHDISRGGVAVVLNSVDAIGTEVELGLPGGGTVKGRIARLPKGFVGISFGQDEAALACIDRALTIIGERGSRKAA